MNFILEKEKCFQELESMSRTISSLLGFLARAAQEEVLGGSINSAPADWLKGPAGFVCV